MSKIEAAKSYTGSDLENIFFRPMLTGPDAQSLGIKVMYNMPVPTTLQYWGRTGDILQSFNSKGWSGSSSAQKYQKAIDLKRVKAEMGYGAEDYFNLVFAEITNRPDVNMGDLSGTELEEAETALFRQAIAESIRATMWLGDTSRTQAGDQFNTFDGILTILMRDKAAGGESFVSFEPTSLEDPEDMELLLKQMWLASSGLLKSLKQEGNLVYLVSSDIYAMYEDYLNEAAYESAYIARQNGRNELNYKGIPVIDLQLSNYMASAPSLPDSFAILTDRRNLALAVNTNDYPGTEVKMWYNPDEMENRQRAVFMAGCDYLLPELITFAYK